MISCDRLYWKEWIDSYPPGFGEDTVERYGVQGKHVFAIQVSVDSMIPDVNDGTILIINPDKAFTNFKGGVGVIKFYGNNKIRKVYRAGDNYQLVPSNPLYKQEVVSVTGTTIFKIMKRIPNEDWKF